VIVTDPASKSFIIGSQTGERDYFYPEFRSLQQENSALAGLCAVESDETHWQIRLTAVNEEIRGQACFGNYFAVLGIEPAQGRFFDSRADELAGALPMPVLSDDSGAALWTRPRGDRAGGWVVQNTVLTIIGVAPGGFLGEAGAEAGRVGAASMEPRLKPGRDWLHAPADPTRKVMWLHAFGR